MKLSQVQLAVIALVVANIIWGAASPIFKWSLENISPFSLAFMRFFIAAFLLLPFAYRDLKIAKHDIMPLLTLTVIGITLHIPIFFYGLRLSSSINAPIISSAAPVFLIIGSIFFLKEKPKRKIIIGTLISLFGIITIILRPLVDNGFDGTIVGNFLFVIATLGSVVYTILLKELSGRYKAAALTFWTFAIASFTLLPFVLIESQSTGFLPNLNTQGLVGIYFGALLSSGLAYYLYAYALKHLKASEVGIFTYIAPVTAVLIALPLLGEVITPTYIIGSVLVILGIFIAEGKMHYNHLKRLKKT